MNKKYDRDIKLRCDTCGSDSHFEFNDDKTYVRCTLCNREYLRGYEELVELNKAYIAEQITILKNEVKQDIAQKLKDTFK